MNNTADSEESVARISIKFIPSCHRAQEIQINSPAVYRNIQEFTES